MKKIISFRLIFMILIGLTQQSFSQNSIILNGEKIKVKKFIVNGTRKALKRMEYKTGDNLNLSPFFGQDNGVKFEGKTNCEIGYSRLGYLCPQAFIGKAIVDFKSPREFLPLFTSSKSEDSWDSIIFDYFTNHTDGINQDFIERWNSEKLASNKAKRDLLFLPENKQTRDLFYNKFIDEVTSATYTKKTKKEEEIIVKLEAVIQAELSDHLKSIVVDDNTANKIKSETKVGIDKKLNSTNIIEIKYFSLRLNGTFLGLVNEYAKEICSKNLKKQPLTKFENTFYEEYMKKNNVFLISNMQYILFKIDKTKITNLITEISQDIDASLAKNQIKGLDASFSANVNVKVNKEINEDFKSEGGYVMQIAESGQFAEINAECK